MRELYDNLCPWDLAQVVKGVGARGGVCVLWEAQVQVFLTVVSIKKKTIWQFVKPCKWTNGIKHNVAISGSYLHTNDHTKPLDQTKHPLQNILWIVHASFANVRMKKEKAGRGTSPCRKLLKIYTKEDAATHSKGQKENKNSQWG